jgi:hypothetical protein
MVVRFVRMIDEVRRRVNQSKKNPALWAGHLRSIVTMSLSCDLTPKEACTILTVLNHNLISGLQEVKESGGDLDADVSLGAIQIDATLNYG